MMEGGGQNCSFNCPHPPVPHSEGLVRGGKKHESQTYG